MLMHSQLVHMICDGRLAALGRKRLKKDSQTRNYCREIITRTGETWRGLCHVLIDTAISVFHLSRCLPSMVSLVITEIILGRISYSFLHGSREGGGGTTDYTNADPDPHSGIL